MEFKPEKQEREPEIENVRVALFHKGKFLVLEKSANSKNPNALEFPGGKVDHMEGETSTMEEQKDAAMREIQEETHIDVSRFPMEHVEDYSVYFETQKQDGSRKPHRRRVHLFFIRIPDEEEIGVTIDTLKNVEGMSEDKHSGYYWLTPEELAAKATQLEGNETTGEKTYPLTRNSRRLTKLFEVAKK